MTARSRSRLTGASRGQAAGTEHLRGEKGLARTGACNVQRLERAGQRNGQELLRTVHHNWVETAIERVPATT